MCITDVLLPLRAVMSGPGEPATSSRATVIQSSKRGEGGSGAVDGGGGGYVCGADQPSRADVPSGMNWGGVAPSAQAPGPASTARPSGSENIPLAAIDKPVHAEVPDDAIGASPDADNQQPNGDHVVVVATKPPGTTKGRRVMWILAGVLILIVVALVAFWIFKRFFKRSKAQVDDVQTNLDDAQQECVQEPGQAVSTTPVGGCNWPQTRAPPTVLQTPSHQQQLQQQLLLLQQQQQQQQQQHHHQQQQHHHQSFPATLSPSDVPSRGLCMGPQFAKQLAETAVAGKPLVAASSAALPGSMRPKAPAIVEEKEEEDEEDAVERDAASEGRPATTVGQRPEYDGFGRSPPLYPGAQVSGDGVVRQVVASQAMATWFGDSDGTPHGMEV
jgi:cell division protein FtsN